ncbi:unnamed protein product [Prorocentrum cordatum]|uniref:Uncharacterized protein n=1 Tax=Prorocentrum cordatum TaxID=2364126 RepID=A0ABN9PI98_9DINO|nr:unnamed protein product [Polarella glacialis]
MRKKLRAAARRPPPWRFAGPAVLDEKIGSPVARVSQARGEVQQVARSTATGAMVATAAASVSSRGSEQQQQQRWPERAAREQGPLARGGATAGRAPRPRWLRRPQRRQRAVQVCGPSAVRRARGARRAQRGGGLLRGRRPQTGKPPPALLGPVQRGGARRGKRLAR